MSNYDRTASGALDDANWSPSAPPNDNTATLRLGSYACTLGALTTLNYAEINNFNSSGAASTGTLALNNTSAAITCNSFLRATGGVLATVTGTAVGRVCSILGGGIGGISGTNPSAVSSSSQSLLLGGNWAGGSVLNASGITGNYNIVTGTIGSVTGGSATWAIAISLGYGTNTITLTSATAGTGTGGLALNLTGSTSTLTTDGLITANDSSGTGGGMAISSTDGTCTLVGNYKLIASAAGYLPLSGRFKLQPGTQSYARCYSGSGTFDMYRSDYFTLGTIIGLTPQMLLTSNTIGGVVGASTADPESPNRAQEFRAFGPVANLKDPKRW